MSVIVADGLTHRFGRELALEGVDLVLDTAEHMAVLGDNGAGKTTLLRILATALHPTAGTLQIAGLNASREKRRLRHYIGYVAHAPGLYPALSAAENLRFFCDLQGVPHARVDEVLEIVGLHHVADRRASELSRGMQQRLALGRAILHDPKLLILDEPLTGLDATVARQVKDLLQQKVRDGATVILTTHILEVAERLADRIGIIQAGRLRAEGTLAELRTRAGDRDGRETLEDVFLQLVGEPS